MKKNHKKMMVFKIRRIHRIVAVLVAINLLSDLVFPYVLYAFSGGGPIQSEFSKFEPVGTSNMVNDFTGDFTYNIPVVYLPGPAGSGYPLSLSYHSGTSPDDDASWVGYGWTLNPGAVKRNKRGYPDDYRGVGLVKKWNRTRPNKTFSIGEVLGIEGFSLFGVGHERTINLNSYKGLGFRDGINLNVLGTTSLGFSREDGKNGFSYQLSPMGILTTAISYVSGQTGSKEASVTASSATSSISNLKNKGSMNIAGSGYGYMDHAYRPRSTSITESYGQSLFGRLAIQGNYSIPLGSDNGVIGSVSMHVTTQEGDDSKYVAGYMYSGDAESKNDALMDYYYEKESTYKLKNRYLGIPFSNADDFVASGEGINGGFRLYHRKAGYFKPNRVTSETKIKNGSLDIHVGNNFGAGTSKADGKQTLEVTEGSRLDGFQFAKAEDMDEAYFFRFYGDMGGGVDFGIPDDRMYAANLMDDGTPVKPSELKEEMNEGARSGRSSYIAYHTNQELKAGSSPGGVFKSYRAYSRDFWINQFVDKKGDESIYNGIGEFAITNESGKTFIYGLPVYNRNEKSFDVNIYPLDKSTGVDDIGVVDNHIAYKRIMKDNGGFLKPPSGKNSDNTKNSLHTVIGEEHVSPYASAFLLTEITTPDYIDLKADGPTNDDVGGWTKFKYKQWFGNTAGDGRKDENGGEWYKWRMPYTGLSYNAGELSDKFDDLGSFSSGEREVYYIDEIETRTHYVKFYTSDRADGIQAAEDYIASADPSAKSNSQKRLQKLDKIELWTKGRVGDPDDDQLIKTIHFEYTYDLLPQSPNSNASSGGRLSLKRMWTDEGDVLDAKISPYEFGYEYSNADYPAKYDAIEADNNLYSSTQQNPDYNEFNIDRWGFYRPDNIDRKRKFMPWVDQKPMSNGSPLEFDPAAYHLKVIKLPSGGEIHVQYEEKKYLWVQDKKAMAMVSIKSQNGNRFYLDADNDLDLSTSDLDNNGIADDKEALEAELKRVFLEDEEPQRLYFKFLYSLLFEGIPDLGNLATGMDYITGYAGVSNVGIENGDLFIELKSSSGSNLYLPRQICQEMVKTSKIGNITAGLPDDAPHPAQKISFGEVLSMIEKLVHHLPFHEKSKSNTCLEFNEDYSYLRIPVVKEKRGGGVRVKRLLMYNEGIEPGEKSLLGSEYIYEDKDGNSTGVATNEPLIGRDENAIVQFLESNKISTEYRIFAGMDIEQSEGPLGESIMAGPGIGYEQVIIKNIHDGKSTTGYTIKEYHTARDEHYFNVIHTDILKEEDYKQDNKIISSSLKDYLWLSQGYQFISHDKHGRIKSIRNFEGNYDPNELGTEVSSTVYSYFKPTNAVLYFHKLYKNPEQDIEFDMSDVNGNSISVTFGDITPDYNYPGKETEVILASKQIEDNYFNTINFGDMTLTALPPVYVPFFTLFGTEITNKSLLSTHVITAVKRIPVILKSVTTKENGIEHFSEYTGFDPFTGSPAKSVTTDGYDGQIMKYSANHRGLYNDFDFRGTWYYPALRQKSETERRIYTSGNGMEINYKYNSWYKDNGHSDAEYFLYIEDSDSDPFTSYLCDVKLVPGDLVKLSGNGTACQQVFHIGEQIEVTDIGDVSDPDSKVFELFHHGAFGGTSGLSLCNNVVVEVLKSGLTNQLNASVGNTVSYGAPVISSVNNAELQKRQQLADKLNEFVFNVTGGRLTQSSPELAGLKIYDPADGVCKLASDLSIVISVNENYDCTGGWACKFEPIVTVDYNGISMLDPCPDIVIAIDDVIPYFFIDNKGNLVYYDMNDCDRIPIGCFNFCPEEYDGYSATNVITTGASSLSQEWKPWDEWAYPSFAYDDNPYLSGERGKWRLKSSYAYKTSIKSGNVIPGRAYNSGMFDMILFNWDQEQANGAWLKTNEILSYSPNGDPVLEEDALQVKTVSRMGGYSNGNSASIGLYNQPLPLLVAKNANKNEVRFESFEKQFLDLGTGEIGTDKFENGNSSSVTHAIDKTIAHAGSQSYKFELFGSHELIFEKIGIEKNMLVRFWGREFGGGERNSFSLKLDDRTNEFPFTPIARAGEWVLYEAVFDQGTGNTGDETTFRIYTTDNSFEFWVDDVSIQPTDAEMTCYVIDPVTLRPLTTFDRNHFGSYNQYNQEGKIVRKWVETDEGKKPVVESQLWLPKIVTRP